MALGQNDIKTIGRQLRISSDGRPEWKAGGITVDWSLVTAVNADTTLADGTVVKNGDKYLLAGTVLCILTSGNTGKYAPYLTGATNGQQTLTRGKCYILDKNLVLSEEHSDIVSAMEGGRMFINRITGVSGNPSEANVLTAFPRLLAVRD